MNKVILPGTDTRNIVTPLAPSRGATQCAICRRPTSWSRFCGQCRVWHEYLTRVGSLQEVSR
jgi:hypothetical protein